MTPWEPGKVDRQAQVQDVEQPLGATSDAEWEESEAVGEGDAFRADFADDHASALAFQDTIVHCSVVAGV